MRRPWLPFFNHSACSHSCASDRSVSHTWRRCSSARGQPCIIPIRDSEASRRLVSATMLIILLNTAVFAIQLYLPHQGRGGFWRYAMKRHRISIPDGAIRSRALRHLATIITAMFFYTPASCISPAICSIYSSSGQRSSSGWVRGAIWLSTSGRYRRCARNRSRWVPPREFP